MSFFCIACTIWSLSACFTRGSFAPWPMSSGLLIASTRLNGELTRTCYQLRLFAEVLDEGSYLEATIDHAGPTPMGPRPDLRRMLVPIGPVAVFLASDGARYLTGQIIWVDGGLTSRLNAARR